MPALTPSSLCNLNNCKYGNAAARQVRGGMTFCVLFLTHKRRASLNKSVWYILSSLTPELGEWEFPWKRLFRSYWRCMCFHSGRSGPHVLVPVVGNLFYYKGCEWSSPNFLLQRILLVSMSVETKRLPAGVVQLWCTEAWGENCAEKPDIRIKKEFRKDE